MAKLASSDNIFQAFKLYIEGVQVPFTSISIVQGIGQLPTATISIPPQSGLMDIARFYQPKVHIFFTERNQKTLTMIDKVLFTGLISRVHYSKSKEGNGGASIVYECVHKYFLLTELVLDYSSPIQADSTANIGSGSTVPFPPAFNSQAAIQMAMRGWTEVSSGDAQDYPALAKSTTPRTDILPSVLTNLQNRLIGMPGVLINFWNSLNWASYANNDVRDVSRVFTSVYKPLVETGLQFFYRLMGHYFLEQKINGDSRMPSCSEGDPKAILVPPKFNIFVNGTAATDLVLQNLGNFLSNSNEITNIYKIFQLYLSTLDYDWVTLSSPAEVLMDPSKGAIVEEGKNTYAADTIVKPAMPFYFSPACNVLYPSMYTAVQVSFDEASVPTRLDVSNTQAFNGEALHFRAPASVRMGIALKNSVNPDLSGTKLTSFGALGQFEMGRGAKVEWIDTPAWLARILTTKDAAAVQGTTSGQSPVANKNAESAMADLRTAWAARYQATSGNPNIIQQPPKMNPYAPESNVATNERVLFTTADYYFTKKYASSKYGSVNCLFNPYIIPGYPMDIMESNPNLPSYHASCVSVVHNITAQSVSTQVNFVAAMTYTEIANYYVPFMNPYLEDSMGLTLNPSLVGHTGDASQTAVKAANEYYFNTLGVYPALPEILYDFVSGNTRSVQMTTMGLSENGGVPLGKHSFEDDLMNLCYRPIESKDLYASRNDLLYIDMTAQNYSLTGIEYEPRSLTSDNVASKFEIGQSQFLDYSLDVYEEIMNVSLKDFASTKTGNGTVIPPPVVKTPIKPDNNGVAFVPTITDSVLSSLSDTASLLSNTLK